MCLLGIYYTEQWLCRRWPAKRVLKGQQLIAVVSDSWTRVCSPNRRWAVPWCSHTGSAGVLFDFGFKLWPDGFFRKEDILSFPAPPSPHQSCKFPLRKQVSGILYSKWSVWVWKRDWPWLTYFNYISYSWNVRNQNSRWFRCSPWISSPSLKLMPLVLQHLHVPYSQARVQQWRWWYPPASIVCWGNQHPSTPQRDQPDSTILGLKWEHVHWEILLNVVCE